MRRRVLLGTPLALAACASPRMAPAPALERIAAVSCIDQTQRPQPIWDAVHAARPDLLLFAGDNVYASRPPWNPAALAQAYEDLGRIEGLARLRREVPHLAIWDDHDYGLNDGGAGFAHRQASKDLFLQAWQVPPDDERRGRAGLYHARRFGPPGRRVQVILLDLRWFKSPWRPTDRRDAPGRERYLPDDDPAATLLGDAQWAWLEDRLREPADLRLLVSGIQVLAEGHGWEHWGLFPRERRRLFDLIGRTGARGVLLLSGDRHVGAMYRQAAGVPYPLLEMTSSGITHPWKAAAEPGPNRLGPLVGERHFGMVEIDWPGRRVALVLRGEQGAVLQRHALAFDELRPQ